MTARLFGTDGIRGPAGSPPLDPETVRALGCHFARRLGTAVPSPRVILGGDTRESTAEICRWLAEGLVAGGGDFLYAGVLPTPGLTFLIRHLGAQAAVVVSASHNPHPDNGIKLLDHHGFKLGREAETDLETSLAGPAPAVPELPAGPLRPQSEVAEAAEAYLDHLAASLGGAAEAPLAGLEIALDPGNGAASPYAERLFTSLGARVAAIHDRPDGRNINREAGSTHPGEVAKLVRERGCDLGFAFDGDADRVILADAQGRIRDGDAVLYLWASELAARGELDPPAIVATSMSNLGLERALGRRGISVVRCDVGDRVVAETLRREGLLLGGEQSGHIIHLGLGTTGDGLQTALRIAALVKNTGRPLADLLAGFERFPQILHNVRVKAKPDFSGLPGVGEIAGEVERTLGEEGRLVLRYSGTESLARIMIEGPDQRAIEAMALRLAAAIEKEIGVERALTEG